MGIMDKVKKILFDEDVVEVPVSSDELPERTPKNVKKEEKHESTGFIEYHRHEEVEENPIKEVKVPKEEVVREEKRSFNFPEDIDFEREIPTRQKNYEDMNLSLFDEDDEVKSEGIVNSYRVSEPIKEPAKKEIKDYRKMLGNEKGENEKKPFQNTPVISPVWGILDKNYKPEEIVNRAERITKVNTGAVPRSYGPVSYNDQPLPVKKYDKKDNSMKEDLVELNSTISDMINDDVEDIKNDLPRENIRGFEEEIENIVEEEILPTHSIDDIHEEANDEVIQTSDYDEYDEISNNYDDIKSIEEEETEHNSIEDAFESTSEFDSIKERDFQDDNDDEEEPLVDLKTLVDKKDDDDDDAGLDNTIETDLFNLIDSMYKDDEEE